MDHDDRDDGTCRGLSAQQLDNVQKRVEIYLKLSESHILRERKVTRRMLPKRGSNISEAERERDARKTALYFDKHFGQSEEEAQRELRDASLDDVDAAIAAELSKYKRRGDNFLLAWVGETWAAVIGRSSWCCSQRRRGVLVRGDREGREGSSSGGRKASGGKKISFSVGNKME